MSTSSATICLLCEAPAPAMVPVAPSGELEPTTWVTRCGGCGEWVIPHRDLPYLQKQTPDTTHHIAEMARGHLKKRLGVPFQVDAGLIDIFRR